MSAQVDDRKNATASRLKDRPFGRGQLYTLEFALLSTWVTLGMFKAIGYLGTARGVPSWGGAFTSLI